MLVPLAFAALTFFAAGCSESHEVGTPCCVETDGFGFGTLSSCHCPAGWACNYAPFADCGGGVCRIGSRTEPGICEGGDGGVDAGPVAVPDAPPDAAAAPDVVDGFWERCCETGSDGIGHVSTCFCPAGWACNYGLFSDCGDGTCATFECPGDGGEVDGGTGAE